MATITTAFCTLPDLQQPQVVLYPLNVGCSFSIHQCTVYAPHVRCIWPLALWNIACDCPCITISILQSKNMALFMRKCVTVLLLGCVCVLISLFLCGTCISCFAVTKCDQGLVVEDCSDGSWLEYESLCTEHQQFPLSGVCDRVQNWYACPCILTTLYICGYCVQQNGLSI